MIPYILPRKWDISVSNLDEIFGPEMGHFYPELGAKLHSPFPQNPL